MMKLVPVAMLFFGMLLTIVSNGVNHVFWIGGILFLCGLVYFLILIFFGNAKKVDDWLAK